MRQGLSRLLVAASLLNPLPAMASEAARAQFHGKPSPAQSLPKLEGLLNHAGLPPAPAIAENGQARVQASLDAVLKDISVERLKAMAPGELNGVGRLIAERMERSSSIPTISGSPSVGGQGGGFSSGNFGGGFGHGPTPSGGSGGNTGKRIYLLPKRLEVTARLGIVAKVLHYGIETAIQIGKAVLLYMATHEYYGPLTLLAIELFKMPPMIVAQSMADLKLRYWLKRRRALRELRQVPEIESIKVLSAGEVEFQGAIAHKQANRGLVFLESSAALPAADLLGFGAPIHLEDLSKSRLRLVFDAEGVESPSVWEPSLEDLFARRPLPFAVAESWRQEIRRRHREMSWRRRWFDFSKDNQLKVKASLIESSGRQTYLGVLTQARSALSLLGLTHLQRLWGLTRKERPLPLSSLP